MAKDIFNTVREPLVVLDGDLRVALASNSFYRFFNTQPEETVGRPIYELGNRQWDIPQLRKLLENIIPHNTSFENYVVDHDFSPNGKRIMILNARQVQRSFDKEKFILLAIEDVTERKLAEEKLAKTLDKLRKSLIGTIQALSLMVESKDPYTTGHQKRVSNLARNIAQQMGLPNDTVENIRLAGTIHDIGKISVPIEILVKPGKLSDIEFNLIKTHSKKGYEILKDSGLNFPIAETVLQHHERLNGSGYPYGLKGEEILLEARILAVADVIEAISSYRPYRPAVGIDAALEEIEKNKGILYDDKVVEVCVRLFREKGFVFESTVS